MAEALRSTGAEALRELAGEDRAVEIRCQLCGTAYSFPPAELLALAEEDGTDEADSTHKRI